MHRFVALMDVESGESDSKKVYLYKAPRKGAGKYRQVLWGDFLRIDDADPRPAPGWLKVLWAQAKDPETGIQPPPFTCFVEERFTSLDRPLEMIFLDVGQGDSAILISPERGADERIMLIDGGIGDNLDRYLRSRFRYHERGLHIHAAIITHPDEDHYGGFREIFASGKFSVDHIYHNGLAERPVIPGKTSSHSSRLGAVEKDADNGKTYHIDLMETHADAKEIYGGALEEGTGKIGNMEYPQLINEALRQMPNAQVEMLSTEHGIKHGRQIFMPGFAPDDDRGFQIEVLGPVPEPDSHRGLPRLRRIASNNGKTKNGHSVLLRLTFGRFSVLFGGDLNAKAEKMLLQHYGGELKSWPKSNERRHAMVMSARRRFESDLLKVCHHGAADVTDEFLQAVNPAAFVISSGDEEGHVHPRPDLLGRLGRNGRGFAPLLLSTELQRSTRESEDKKDAEGIEKDTAKLAGITGISASQNRRREKLTDKIGETVKRLARRNVSVYGAIHVKTDGNKLIVAFRIETDSMTKRWHYYEYSRDANGVLVPKHEVV